MIGARLVSVNLAAVVLCGCAEPSEIVATSPVFEVPPTQVEHSPQLGPGQHGIIGTGPATLPAGRIGDLPEQAIHASLADDTSIMLKLAASLTNVTWAEDGGEEIDAALAGFSKQQIKQNGVGLLTAVQLFGDPFHESLCEAPELGVSLDDADGGRWDARLSLPQYTAFVGDLSVPTSALSQSCTDGLLASGGDVGAAVAAGDCGEDEEQQYFGRYLECRTCVEAAVGDFAACVDAGECEEKAPQVTWVLEDGEKAWYQLLQGVAWACRPDWLASVYVLAHVPPDGTLPPSYDHADWNYYCFPLYDPTTDAVGYSCDAGDAPERGHTLGEGVLGRTIDMTDAKGNIGFGQRQFYSPSVTLDTGARLRWSWANSSNVGRLSKPIVIEDTNGDGVAGPEDEGWGYGSDSWGVNPHALRPGGTDETSLDDTFARDWLALITLKTATTMDGISISVSNISRCTSWEENALDGSYRCSEAVAPVAGWLNDALHYGHARTDGQTYSYAVPITTIGSTGLPDRDVPGGIVPLIAGSNRLAESQWEDCVWPHSFVADQIAFLDTPWDYAGPHSLWGDTYRFGKDSDLDLRMVLNTNIARHYCPEEL